MTSPLKPSNGANASPAASVTRPSSTTGLVRMEADADVTTPGPVSDDDGGGAAVAAAVA